MDPRNSRRKSRSGSTGTPAADRYTRIQGTSNTLNHKHKISILGGTILAPLVVGLGLLGCRPAGEKQIVIGLTVPSLSHPFFVCLKKHVEDEAKKLGVRVITMDAEDVSAKQMSIIEDFIAQGVDGVLMAPIGAEALTPAVEALNRAHVPVATVDRKVAGGDILVHVGADNVAGGRAAARYIVAKLGGKGAVIELEGTPGASPAIDRKKGFDEVLAASSMKLLASQAADFYRAKGQSVMENLLQAHHDFQAVYAANDEMVLGAWKPCRPTACRRPAWSPWVST